MIENMFEENSVRKFVNFYFFSGFLIPSRSLFSSFCNFLFTLAVSSAGGSFSGCTPRSRSIFLTAKLFSTCSPEIFICPFKWGGISRIGPREVARTRRG